MHLQFYFEMFRWSQENIQSTSFRFSCSIKVFRSTLTNTNVWNIKFYNKFRNLTVSFKSRPLSHLPQIPLLWLECISSIFNSHRRTLTHWMGWFLSTQKHLQIPHAHWRQILARNWFTKLSLDSPNGWSVWSKKD